MPASFERLAVALRGLLRDRRPLWRIYLELRWTLRGRRALVWLLLLGFVAPWLVFIKGLRACYALGRKLGVWHLRAVTRAM